MRRDAVKKKNFNVRLSDEEIAVVEELREQLEKDLGVGVHVTQRTVIVRALKVLRDKLKGP